MLKRIAILFASFLVLFGLLPFSNPQPIYAAKRIAAKIQTKEQTVYITRTGSKYHNAGCRYLRKSCIPMTKSQAENSGLSPCSKCW